MTPLTVTPVPDTVTVGVPKKFVPVRVTATALGVVAVPRGAAFGATEVNVGAGGITTVNATALLGPPGAVTVMFLAVPAAPVLITKFAFTWVSLTTVKPVTVIPPPVPLIAVVPVSPLPKRETETVVPRSAEAGEIDVSTGPSTV